MPALAIPAFWYAVSAAAGGASAIYAAKTGADASDRAVDAQTAATDKTLAFQKDQAAEDKARFDATQRANYDQWVARQKATNSLRAIAGLPPVDIPAYVPTTGSGAPGAPTSPVSLVSAPKSSTVNLVQQAVNKGLTGSAAVDYINSLQPGSAVLVPAGSATPAGKIAWYDKGNGAGKFQMTGPESWEIKTDPALGQGWIYNPLGAPSAAPTAAPSKYPPGSLAALLYPNVSAPTAPIVRTPTLPPGSLGSYFG